MTGSSRRSRGGKESIGTTPRPPSRHMRPRSSAIDPRHGLNPSPSDRVHRHGRRVRRGQPSAPRCFRTTSDCGTTSSTSSHRRRLLHMHRRPQSACTLTLSLSWACSARPGVCPRSGGASCMRTLSSTSPSNASRWKTAPSARPRQFDTMSRPFSPRIMTRRRRRKNERAREAAAQAAEERRCALISYGRQLLENELASWASDDPKDEARREVDLVLQAEVKPDADEQRVRELVTELLDRYEEDDHGDDEEVDDDDDHEGEFDD